MSNAEGAARVIDAAPLFAALGDPTRLALVARLSDGRVRSIASLSADAAMTRQAVTKHLHVLEKAGLVAQERRGRESRFRLDPKPLDDLRLYLDQVSRHWDVALERLRRMVEER